MWPPCRDNGPAANFLLYADSPAFPGIACARTQPRFANGRTRQTPQTGRRKDGRTAKPTWQPRDPALALRKGRGSNRHNRPRNPINMKVGSGSASLELWSEAPARVLIATVSAQSSSRPLHPFLAKDPDQANPKPAIAGGKRHIAYRAPPYSSSPPETQRPISNRVHISPAPYYDVQLSAMPCCADCTKGTATGLSNPSTNGVHIPRFSATLRNQNRERHRTISFAGQIGSPSR